MRVPKDLIQHVNYNPNTIDDLVLCSTSNDNNYWLYLIDPKTSQKKCITHQQFSEIKFVAINNCIFYQRSASLIKYDFKTNDYSKVRDIGFTDLCEYKGKLALAKFNNIQLVFPDTSFTDTSLIFPRDVHFLRSSNCSLYGVQQNGSKVEFQHYSSKNGTSDYFEIEIKSIIDDIDITNGEVLYSSEDKYMSSINKYEIKSSKNTVLHETDGNIFSLTRKGDLIIFGNKKIIGKSGLYVYDTELEKESLLLEEPNSIIRHQLVPREIYSELLEMQP